MQNYSLVGASTLAHHLQLLATEKLDLITFRVFLATLEVSAIQAINRSIKGHTSPSPLHLIQKLTGIKHENTVRKALRKLKEVEITPNGCLRLPRIASEGAIDLLDTLCRGRSYKRSVPCPRPQIRYLARTSHRGQIVTMVSLWLRLGSYHKSQGVKATGSCTQRLIASVGHIGQSSVRAAFGALRRLGFIKTEKPATQKNFMKRGYFIHLLFSTTNSSGTPRLSTSDLSGNKRDSNLLRDGKDQKQEKLVSIKKIQGEKLNNLDYVLALYRDGVRRKLFQNSESALLDFFCAAKEAQKGRNPAALFFDKITNNFRYISEATEHYVQQKLKVFRDRKPEVFSF